MFSHLEMVLLKGKRLDRAFHEMLQHDYGIIILESLMMNETLIAVNTPRFNYL